MMVEKPASVRLATYKDEAAILSTLIDMHRHNDSGWGYPFDLKVVQAQIEVATRQNPFLRSSLGDNRAGVIGVIDGPGGAIVATIGLFIQPIMWFTTVPAMLELWVYVQPDFRRSRHESDLRSFGQWAHANMKAKLMESWDHEFHLFTGFHHHGNRFGSMLRLWRRWGGKLCGALFLID